VATGGDVRPEQVRGRLEDVTPTVLSLLGVPVPAGLDGAPLPFARTAAAPAEGPALAEATRAEESTGYTEEEEEAVRRRLESLGYL